MKNSNFNVTIHFNNGISIERVVPLSKAAKLSSKKNVIVPSDTEFVEVRSINNSIIIPLNMVFVISQAPNFKHIDRVSRYMLYKRDKGKCAYCGKEISQHEATVDHVIPKARGGEHVWENVVLACKKCNCKKDNYLLEEIGMKLTFKPYNPKRVKTR